MNDRTWNEVFDEFRALGGTADNVCVREGIYGRGIFPIDPGKPVTLRVPENLLIDSTDAMFEGRQFRIGLNAKAGPRERRFFEDYMNTFSWPGGRSEIERLYEQAQQLPVEVREALNGEYRMGDWFQEPTEETIERCFIETRHILYKDRTVIMPIIELLNHSPSSQHFKMEKGVTLTGVFGGEVTARYSDTDALGVFASWGFACEQPQAFSMSLKSSRSENAVRVNRDLSALSPKADFWVPKLSKIENGVALEFLMLGNKKYPRVSKGIFYKLLREAGAKDYEESFDLIQRANLTRIAGLLALVEKAEGAMAQTLRQTARYQLQALACCVGVREV